MYAQLTGLYLFTLPVAYLGAVTSIGITALYAAIVLEMAVPAAITYYRYRSDTWKVVSRDYRPDAAATTDWIGRLSVLPALNGAPPDSLPRRRTD